MTGPGCPSMSEYHAHRSAQDAVRRGGLLACLRRAELRDVRVVATPRGLRRIGHAPTGDYLHIDARWLERAGLIEIRAESRRPREMRLTVRGRQVAAGDVAMAGIAAPEPPTERIHEIAPGITLSSCRPLSPEVLRAIEEVARLALQGEPA